MVPPVLNLGVNLQSHRYSYGQPKIGYLVFVSLIWVTNYLSKTPSPQPYHRLRLSPEHLKSLAVGMVLSGFQSGEFYIYFI